MNLSTRMPIWLALVGNLVVVAVTVGLLGWNSAGGHAAARNTARFSALWCAIALAGPAVCQIFRNGSESRLIHAFVAAHSMHFLAVLAVLATYERAHIAARPGESVAVIAVGSLLMLGLAYTAAAARRLTRAIRSLTLYAASLIFFLAFYHHTVRPIRGIAALLAIALILRVTTSLTFRPAPARPA